MTESLQPLVLAVLVLYGRPAAESPSYNTLAAFQRRTGENCTIDLLLVDNSSPSFAPPAHLHGEYVCYPSNPGLAQPYNEGLARAAARGIAWLLLLDQDTVVTEAYLEEVLHELAQPQTANVAAYVPKLFAGGGMLSPHTQQYRPTQSPLTTTVQGIAGRRLHYFNSGAVLSVAALCGIRGFPQDFWLDYLDHAVFFQLQQAGGRVKILHSALQHDLSSTGPKGVPGAAQLQRQRNIQQAAMRYYQRYEPVHRLLQHRLSLLRQAAQHFMAGRTQVAKEVARLAIQTGQGA